MWVVGGGGEKVWGGTFETKVAARNGKSSISTILRGKERSYLVLLIHRFFKPSLSSLFTEHLGFFLARLKKVKVTMIMKRQRKI